MENSKPKIFISSTVYDFRDLRSALKFHLESLGFDVLLSEFNDFTKELDKNSFNACLETINLCDYYILLIGNRVGGYYDKENKVSITQKEYRKAYESATQGKLKLLMFVRSEIWNIRQDRKALKNYLQNHNSVQFELSPEDIDNISEHKSTIVNDAKFILSFIREIDRKDEMIKAQKGETDFPKNNWIHQFSSYHDIIDALNVEFKFATSLSKIAVSENLKFEILSNLRALATKLPKGGICFCNDRANSAREYFIGDPQSFSEIPSKALRKFSLYCVLGTVQASNLSSQFTDSALISGQFLEYDNTIDSYKPSVIQQGLIKLKFNIERLSKLEEIFENHRIELYEKYKSFSNSDTSIKVPNTDLISAFAIYDCQFNIIFLMVYLYKALNGENKMLDNFKTRPTSPLSGIAKRMDEDRFSQDELIELLDKM